MPAQSADKPELPRGAWLGRYQLLRPLESGGMGQLYLARASEVPGFEKLVVLKRVLATEPYHPDFGRMLFDEARLMASLHHPNIAQVYDAGMDGDCPYFTMEYVHGENLTRLLTALSKRGRGLTLSNALWIVMSAAAGLHYAHEKRLPNGEPWGIVHRDVSPGNIMISFDGVVKVIDFGIAKAVARSVATRPGMVKGNLRYMSPEQFLGAPLTRQSDLFSLGIVLFELTTGTRWQRERDDQLAAQQMVHGPLPLPSERRSGYPAELEAIVLKALARAPAERFADAQQLQQALASFAAQQALVPSNIELGHTLSQLFAERAALSTQRELLDAPGHTPPAHQPLGAGGTLKIARPDAPGPNVQDLPAGPEPRPPPRRNPRSMALWLLCALLISTSVAILLARLLG
jgi:eukaryotic-like serine/threonine-protein kinase